MTAPAPFLPLPAPVRDAGLLIARVLLGVILIAHGWQKFHTWGLGTTGDNFDKMGVPAASLSAGFAATVELVGGVLLILGVVTTIVGVLVAIDMLGAFLFVHADKGLFATDGGWELVAALGLAAAVFALVGPGRFAVDALLPRRRGARTPVTTTAGERTTATA